MSFLRASISAVIPLVAVVVTAGCASKPPPAMQPPAAQVTLGHFSGSPLSGPTARQVTIADPSAALSVNVRLIALAEQPAQDNLGPMAPMAPQVRLITGSGAGAAVLPAGQLTRGCRFVSGDAANAIVSAIEAFGPDQKVELASYHIAVPRNITAAVRAQAALRQPLSVGEERGQHARCDERDAGIARERRQRGRYRGGDQQLRRASVDPRRKRGKPEQQQQDERRLGQGHRVERHRLAREDDQQSAGQRR